MSLDKTFVFLFSCSMYKTNMCNLNFTHFDAMCELNSKKINFHQFVYFSLILMQFIIIMILNGSCEASTQCEIFSGSILLLFSHCMLSSFFRPSCPVFNFLISQLTFHLRTLCLNVSLFCMSKCDIAESFKSSVSLRIHVMFFILSVYTKCVQSVSCLTFSEYACRISVNIHHDMYIV